MMKEKGAKKHTGTMFVSKDGSHLGSEFCSPIDALWVRGKLPDEHFQNT